MNAKVSIIIIIKNYYCLRTTPKSEETSLSNCSNFPTRLADSKVKIGNKDTSKREQGGGKTSGLSLLLQAKAKVLRDACLEFWTERAIAGRVTRVIIIYLDLPLLESRCEASKRAEHRIN